MQGISGRFVVLCPFPSPLRATEFGSKFGSTVRRTFCVVSEAPLDVDAEMAAPRTDHTAGGVSFHLLVQKQCPRDSRLKVDDLNAVLTCLSTASGPCGIVAASNRNG